MPGKACNKYSGKKKQDCLNYKGEFAKMKGTQKPDTSSKDEQNKVGWDYAEAANSRTRRRNKRNAARKY